MEGDVSAILAFFLTDLCANHRSLLDITLLVCSFPMYRHPADESPSLLPFSPTVALIREHVQRVLAHPVNHVLIQHYRSGKDYISEHSDKTIDVVRGSYIVNVSLGAQRVMTLRSKRDARAARGAVDDATVQDISRSDADTDVGLAPTPRTVQRIPLPHNSMFVMGPETNKRWLHGINHDNRPVKTKTDAERYEGGERISLTFRHIGTFLTKGEEKIYGQGATAKTREEARPVVRGTEEGERLIAAFGKENQESEFDWDGVYGKGFDVLHFSVH
jgi:alkylated DNA repair dioxygenase AlkB